MHLQNFWHTDNASLQTNTTVQNDRKKKRESVWKCVGETSILTSSLKCEITISWKNQLCLCEWSVMISVSMMRCNLGHSFLFLPTQCKMLLLYSPYPPGQEVYSITGMRSITSSTIWHISSSGMCLCVWWRMWSTCDSKSADPVNTQARGWLVP